GQLVPRDRLGHEAAGTCTDDADDVFGRVRDGECEELDGGTLGRDRGDDCLPAPIRQVDVEQHHLRTQLADERDGVEDAAGLADDLGGVAQLVPDAGAEQLVVVDEEDAPFHLGRLRVSSTSVPSPGADVIVATPPARFMRPSIDSATPRRSGGTVARSKPRPRARTKTEIASASAAA